MSRLIDADALKEGLKEKMFGHPFERIFLSSVVDSEPTIDAVPVVRCKDCKHRFKDSWCEYADDDDNFYCARGERKEGADNG